MKNMKRLFSVFLATAISVSSVSAVSANAGVPEKFTEEKFSDCIKLEDFKWICDDNSEAAYMSSSEHGTTIYNVKRDKDIIQFQSGYDSDTKAIEEKIKSVNEDFLIKWSPVTDKTTGKIILNCLVQKNGAYDIDIEEARKLFNELKENISSFNYKFNYYYYTYTSYKSLLHYEIYTDYESDISEKTALLENYIAENNSFAKLDVNNTTTAGGSYFAELTVIPNESLDAMEQYEIAKDIQAVCGMYPYGVSPTDMMSGSYIEDIDFYNAISGDANDDAKLSLADAVSIMQAVGNPDEYGLTPQGEYNADIVGEDDGITNLDALTIQRKLLKLE